MAEMLSQAEIDALLGGDGDQDDNTPDSAAVSDEILTSHESDILGEIGNISMGTAATTLSALLNQRVVITTPRVAISTWKDIADHYSKPCVGVRIDYTQGLQGTNILILVNRDVKIITNLMMGGDGQVEGESELTDLDLSAIGEAMNQMIGSASTSLASLTNEKVDIATPHAFEIDFTDANFFNNVNSSEKEQIVAVTFKMQVGDLIDSTIVQALPIEFAKDLSGKMMVQFGQGPDQGPPPEPVQTAPQQVPEEPVETPQQTNIEESVPQPSEPEGYGAPYQEAAYMSMQMNQSDQIAAPNVNAQAVQFQTFDATAIKQQKENIDILMDVPLEVTVELGKTSKKIKEILEFSPGTIIELDKLAGEPIDILVNGKYVAKGEVVVIDENFAIRVTSIISTELRI